MSEPKKPLGLKREGQDKPRWPGKPSAGGRGRTAEPRTRSPQPQSLHDDLPEPSQPSYNRQTEMKAYGEKACQRVFAERPGDIIRLYLSEKMAPRFGPVMKHLAANKRAYHLVEEEELEKLAASQHHGGVVMLLRKRPWLTLAQYLAQRGNNGADCVIALDGVANPHNLGAIIRSCAHFGVRALVTSQPDLAQSGAAMRTAEGGFEAIQVVRCEDLAQGLAELAAAGYGIASTSSHGGEPLYQASLAAKQVLILGEEHQGVSAALAERADRLLAIPGTGAVESLNVSVAASLLIAEWFRQQGL